MNFIEWVIELAQISSWVTVLIFMGIYMLKPLAMFIPLTALYIAAGVIFPTSIALVITFCGILLALISGYYSGKFLGERKVDDYLANHTKVGNFLNNRDKGFLLFCFVYRVLPLPFDLFNMMCGAFKVPFCKYLVVSLLGLSTTFVPYVLIGANITTPQSSQFLLPFGISLAFTLGIFILYKKKI